MPSSTKVVERVVVALVVVELLVVELLVAEWPWVGASGAWQPTLSARRAGSKYVVFVTVQEAKYPMLQRREAARE